MKKIMLVLLLMCVAAGAQVTDSKVNKKVRSCEKRNWPVDDSVCHGYALAMAHEYYVEHPDFFAAPAPVKVPLNFVDAPPITQTRDIYASSANLITKPGCEANVQDNGDIVVSPTKSEDRITGNVTYPETPTCPKYQHNSSDGLQNCYGDLKHPDSNIAICTPVVNCVDDIHTVTEKEWQELMDKIKYVGMWVPTTTVSTGGEK